jgi:hypothetical protein
MKFIVSEKAVKERDGASYSLTKYVEGTDYVSRRAFKGVKRVFRANILDQVADHSVEPTDMIALSVVDPAIVEHKQALAPIIVSMTAVITRPALLDGAVRTATVVRKHQNQRYVETDTLGMVFVGSKGNQVKLNHSIKVKDGCLYLG